MIKHIHVFTPPNIGWLEITLSKEAIKHVWKCIKKAKEDHRHSLVGNLSVELELVDENNWFFKNIIGECLKVYEQQFKFDFYDNIVSHPHALMMKTWWVNYQRKHEFNPIHKHNGLFSFNIWMQIPTHYKQQYELPWSKGTKSPRSSAFVFHYTNILGRPTDYAYHMSPAQEGKMVFFPSSLFHSVYPFYKSNKDRISVAGNITLASEKIVKKFSK